jgi:hypothetical protein
MMQCLVFLVELVNQQQGPYRQFVTVLAARQKRGPHLLLDSSFQAPLLASEVVVLGRKPLPQ